MEFSCGGRDTWAPLSRSLLASYAKATSRPQVHVSARLLLTNSLSKWCSLFCSSSQTTFRYSQPLNPALFSKQHTKLVVARSLTILERIFSTLSSRKPISDSNIATDKEFWAFLDEQPLKFRSKLIKHSIRLSKKFQLQADLVSSKCGSAMASNDLEGSAQFDLLAILSKVCFRTLASSRAIRTPVSLSTPITLIAILAFH